MIEELCHVGESQICHLHAYTHLQYVEQCAAGTALESQRVIGRRSERHGISHILCMRHQCTHHGEEKHFLHCSSELFSIGGNNLDCCAVI